MVVAVVLPSSVHAGAERAVAQEAADGDRVTAGTTKREGMNMRIAELDYRDGKYAVLEHTDRWFDRVQNGDELEARLKERGYLKMTGCLGSGDYGYAVIAYTIHADSGVPQRPFLLEHYFDSGDTYIIIVHDFPTLLHLLHEASTIVLAAMQTGQWVEKLEG